MISSAIGVYFAWKDRQNDDENNYALAGQSFSAWPVSLRKDLNFHVTVRVLNHRKSSGKK